MKQNNKTYEVALLMCAIAGSLLSSTVSMAQHSMAQLDAMHVFQHCHGLTQTHARTPQPRCWQLCHC